VISKQSIRPSSNPPALSWSNRILLLGLAGILFLTLYPFRFNFHVLPNSASPLLLGKSLKRVSVVDALLNILLFVPLGFGLAEKLRERGKSARSVLLGALAVGALLSYTIEFLQLYIPERDSGWEDVFTNGSGSLVGAAFYLLTGDYFVRVFNSTQQSLAAHFTTRRLAIGLTTYFIFWFGLAALLQTQTRLSNWKLDAMLVLGNDGSGSEPWRGQIQALQIWDRAVQADDASSTIPHGIAQSMAPLVDYDFSTPLDVSTESKFVPNLTWVPHAPAETAARGGLSLDGNQWVSTKADVVNLIESLRKTNQFALHVICTPADAAGAADAYGRIVSISDSTGTADITLRQEDANLVFWFRTPLAAKHAQLAWYVPGVFSDHRQRDILYSYDGSKLLLTLDGKRPRLNYRLGPGTQLARIVRNVKPSELAGYNYIFYALVFFVVGAIFGLVRLQVSTATNRRIFTTMVMVLLSSAFLLEFILVGVSGRTSSFGHVALSFVLGIAGFLWARVDETFLVQGDAR